MKRYIQKKMSAAGLGEGITYRRILLFQLCLVGIFVSIFGVLAGLLLGLGLPLFWLSVLASRRARQLKNELPLFIDMLSVMVAAGADLSSAIQKTVAKMRHGYLRAELVRMCDSMDIGAQRAKALSEFAQRVADPDVRSFVALVVQSERFGTPMSKMLTAQAGKMRADRLAMAERAGAVASQKLLFPLIFMIMPATFIVVFAPIVIKFVYGK